MPVTHHPVPAVIDKVTLLSDIVSLHLVVRLSLPEINKACLTRHNSADGDRWAWYPLYSLKQHMSTTPSRSDGNISPMPPFENLATCYSRLRSGRRARIGALPASGIGRFTDGKVKLQLQGCDPGTFHEDLLSRKASGTRFVFTEVVDLEMSDGDGLIEVAQGMTPYKVLSAAGRRWTATI